MTMQSTRRGLLKGGLAVAGLSAFDLPEWVLPVMAQGETRRAVHRPPREHAGASRRSPAARRPDDRRSTHAARFVLHHAALRPPGRRPRRVPAEGVRPGEQAAGALARRSEEDEEHADHLRLRVLRQSSSASGAVQQRTLDRRAAEDRARSGRREERREGVRLLRRRPRRRGSRVPHAEVHGQPAVRPQPLAREGVLG